MKDRFEHFVTSKRLLKYLASAVRNVDVVFRKGNKTVTIYKRSFTEENDWVVTAEIDRNPVSIFDGGSDTKYVNNVRALEDEILRFFRD